MQIVVPMAGAGSRFSEAGYSMPKPLIPIAGEPMVARAVRDLPEADRIVFVCHPDHVSRHRVDHVLRAHFPRCHIVIAPGLTAGQACSVRLAGDVLDRDQPVLVAACDNTHVYDRGRFAETIDSADAVIWTYRGDPRVLARPDWHGWVETASGGRVIRVSVKRPISDTPLCDQAVSGCFWFRTAALMLGAIDQLVAANERVNNEFYLDSVPNLLIDAGRVVRAFEVEKYIGWGTPADLQDFLRWQRYFGQLPAAA